MTAEITRTFLLIGLVTCAAFVGVLAFFPWVDFTPEPLGNTLAPFSEPFSLNGTELSRVQGAVTLDQAADQVGEACSCKRSFGDGYVVAALAAITFALGCAALYFRSSARGLVFGAMIVAVVTFVLAGYNTIAIWEGVGRSHEEAFLVNLNGDIRAELYALTALAGVAAVLGGAALATTTRPVPEDEDFEWDDDKPDLEEVNGWA